MATPIHHVTNQARALLEEHGRLLRALVNAENTTDAEAAAQAFMTRFPGMFDGLERAAREHLHYVPESITSSTFATVIGMISAQTVAFMLLADPLALSPKARAAEAAKAPK